MLRHAPRFLIQPMSKSVHHAIHHHTPAAVKVTRRITSPCTFSCRASLVYCTGGFESTSRLVEAGATASLPVYSPLRRHLRNCLPMQPCRVTPLKVQFPFLPESPPMPRGQRLPSSIRTWFHCRCPSIPPLRVAQPPAPSFRRRDCRSLPPSPAGSHWDSGVTPNVSPKCTGAVDGFACGTCAGAAAVSAAFGCGARIIDGFAALIAGTVSLASISIGFSAGFGSGFGILILGAWSFTSAGLGGGGSFGGGGTFTLGLRRRCRRKDQFRLLKLMLLDHMLGHHPDIKGHGQNRHVDHRGL